MSKVPVWAETHMLSIPSADSQLEVEVRRKTRFGARVYSRSVVSLAELPLKDLPVDGRYELAVSLKAGASLTLQLTLLCTE